MTFEDAQRAHDDEDDEPKSVEVCEDCGQKKCVCTLLEEIGW